MMMNYEISSKMVAQQGKMIKGMKVGFAPSFTVPDIMAPHREMIESLQVGLAASSYTVPDIMAPHREMMKNFRVGLTPLIAVPDIVAPHRKMFEDMKIGLDATFKIANAVERQEDYLKGITTALKHSNLYESGNISNLDISKAIDSVKKNAGAEF